MEKYNNKEEELIKLTEKFPGKHVDDFINEAGLPLSDKSGFDQNLNYARFFFMLRRLPSVMQMAWRNLIEEYKLFCTWEGKRYRVTGASGLGDIWLTSKLDQDIGYEHRVDLTHCSDWNFEP